MNNRVELSLDLLQNLRSLTPFLAKVAGRPPLELTQMRKELVQAIEQAKRCSSAAKNYERLHDEFKENDIYQILFNWGVGGQGAQGKDSFSRHLGIEDPSLLYTYQLETGEDLEIKVGIDQSVTYLVETGAEEEAIRQAAAEKELKGDSPETLIAAEKAYNIEKLRLYFSELRKEQGTPKRQKL